MHSEFHTTRGPNNIAREKQVQGSVLVLRIMAAMSDDMEDDAEFILHAVGTCVEYTVPSFPVISVKLRSVKWQCCAYGFCDTTIYDGFIRDCSTLHDRVYPTGIVAKKSNENAFFVEVSLELKINTLHN